MRGDIVVLASREPYSSKPRVGLVLQSDVYPLTDSVIVVLITGTAPPAESLLRYELLPSPAKKLAKSSWVMIEKITAQPRDRIREIGARLDPADMIAVEGMVELVMGL